MSLDHQFVVLAKLIAEQVIAAQAKLPAPTPWFTTREAAHYLKLSVKTLEAYRWNGTGPAWVGKGKIRRYHRNACDEWLTSGAGK